MTTPPAPYFRSLLKAAEASQRFSSEQRSLSKGGKPKAGAQQHQTKSRWVSWSLIIIAVTVLLMAEAHFGFRLDFGGWRRL